MNKYRYFSDLHGHLPDFKRDTDKDEVCIIAGDLTEFGGKGVKLKEMLTDLCERFKEVIFVPGNHEYYGTHIGTLEKKMRLFGLGNFTLLQDAEYIDRDDVRIIGATLWSDTSSIEYQAKMDMNDYKYIRIGSKEEPWLHKLSPSHTTGIHRNQVHLIKEALTKAPGKCIVITHHAPSDKSIDRRYEGSPLNPAYSTELTLGKWPAYWVHGHIHRAKSYEHHGCTVLCNPMGYRHEYTDFEPLENSFII